MNPSDFFYSMSGKQRLLAFILVAFIVSVYPFLIADNPAAAMIVGLLFVAIIWLTKFLWHPENYGKNKVRMASISVLSVVALSQSYWSQLIHKLLANFEGPPWLVKVIVDIPAPTPSALVLFFVLMGIFIVNYLMRDSTVMKQTEHNGLGSYSEAELRIKLLGLKKRLATDLDEINENSNWSVEQYEPIRAQVELKKVARKNRKVADLLSAIKQDINNKIFLILGDPGSGKSVALRKLAEDLLDEFEQTGKLPIYINLREWKKQDGWSAENPPNTEDLEAFVINDVMKRLKVYQRDFLNEKVDKSDKTMFSALLDAGRFYLILDSFDELPQVLDVDDASNLIDELSSVVYRFLSASHGRGILSSRQYRQPSKKFSADAELIVRPFTERQIYSTIERNSAFRTSQVSEMLCTRPDLGPILRNPFTCGLLQMYSRTKPHQLPANQSELYQNYFDERLEKCKDQMNEFKKKNGKTLTKQDVLFHAQLAANELFYHYGLEGPIEELTDRISLARSEDREIVRWSLEILVGANIARIGKGPERRFSFVHRRFTEYFVAITLLKDPQKLPLASIPQDSRWREALVLVAEVADDDVARGMAEYCWQKIMQFSPTQGKSRRNVYSDLIHPLRFLRTAFRGRVESLQHFRNELGQLVISILRGNSDILIKKNAIEATCILEDAHVNKSLAGAFNLNNDWLSETATDSCRNYGKLGKLLEKRLLSYFCKLDYDHFMSSAGDIIFSLSLSDSFRSINRWCKFRRVDGYIGRLGQCAILVLDPALFLICWLWVKCIVFMTDYIDITTSLRRDKRRLNDSDSLSYKKSNRIILRLVLRCMAWFSGNLKTQLSFTQRKKILIASGFYKGNKSNPMSISVNRNFLVRFGCALGIIFSVSSGYKSITYNTFGEHWLLVPSIFYFVIALTIFPWFYITRTITLAITDKLPDVLLSLIVGAIFFIPAVILFYIFYQIDIHSWVFLGFMSLLIVAMVVVTIKDLYHQVVVMLSDRRTYKDLCKEKNWTREIIAVEFFMFKTDYFRHKYVLYLDMSRADPNGDWPGDELPNVLNDRGSTYLAQMEERWLGLAGA
ncbi:hypothetical protein A5320_16345 [Rheinheimera sp. SA_1]|uniref:NACHT domain-containing protein n=1 Tax=Rheinheimera sp. SA_1 TaxID=1827365 RepID=UPI0007FDB2B6|nr:NACHT domain-containing protein [Rheinheimera sp. SA_1]OBP14207.1 hypothetical protein A5320_16345 [Rheinheimera sp. SA_1]